MQEVIQVLRYTPPVLITSTFTITTLNDMANHSTALSCSDQGRKTIDSLNFQAGFVDLWG